MIKVILNIIGEITHSLSFASNYKSIALFALSNLCYSSKAGDFPEAVECLKQHATLVQLASNLQFTVAPPPLCEDEMLDFRE